jgi:prevent-host-death family protein
MEHRISATELRRRLGHILAGVRNGDSFVIEKSGQPIARMAPLVSGSPVTLREATAVWSQAGDPDPGSGWTSSSAR